jgi:very-short-patch-repair endonuclease
MILDFEPFHRAKNTVGKQDYFSTRITTTKKIKTCCECLFTIAIGEEHHQAIGFWDANYNDWRTCLKCYELQIELENTSVRLNSMLDFRFGKFSKRLKALRSRYPDEFAAFEDEFDLTEIMKRIEKKKGWRDMPMQVHVKLRTNSDFIYCCQCSWEMNPGTRYEEATITQNHDVLGVNKTCLKCVEKRKVLELYFLRFLEDDRLLTTYRRNSIFKALRNLSEPHEIATITDPQVLKLVNDFIAANRRFEYEAEEEFEEEIERRQSGFIPPTTPYEFKLKAALEKDGYEVIHNEPLGYYFPDLLIEKHKCICEVDGGYHLSDRQQAKDAYRTEYLNSKGYFVVRVSNERITRDLALVMQEIRQAIAAKENINLG